MSIKWMTAVFEMELDPTPKLVLLSLADFADEKGECWPSQPVIARMASVSERTVRAHIGTLVEAGFVKLVQRGNGAGRTSRYRLDKAKIKAAGISAFSDKKEEADDKKAEDGAQKAESVFRRSVIDPPDPSDQVVVGARAREARRSTEEKALADLYYRTFGHEAVDAVIEELKGIKATHPAACMQWVWREITGARNPSWGLARFKFNECMMRGHGPRDRPFTERLKDGDVGRTRREKTERTNRTGRPDPRW